MDVPFIEHVNGQANIRLEHPEHWEPNDRESGIAFYPSKIGEAEAEAVLDLRAHGGGSSPEELLVATVNDIHSHSSDWEMVNPVPSRVHGKQAASTMVKTSSEYLFYAVIVGNSSYMLFAGVTQQKSKLVFDVLKQMARSVQF